MYSLYRWRWSPASPLLKTAAKPSLSSAQNSIASIATEKNETEGDERKRNETRRDASKRLRPTSSTALNALSILILSLALSSLADGAYIHAKANLAQWLIGNAWQQSQAAHGDLSTDGRAIKPWPWADTWPVARLQYDKGQQDLYILAGAQGNSLAFGPGHLYGSATPGTLGVSVVGGHRDTHFAFLEELKPGDVLSVTPLNGKTQQYVIAHAEIADSMAGPLLAAPYSSQLILVTCYPFDALTSGPMRYVVTAELTNPIKETLL